MKTLICCENLYDDIDSISTLISTLEFANCARGKEIEQFYHIPPDLTDLFTHIIGEDIEIQPDTGIFRKPNSLIHFDDFYQHSRWACIVALEDTELKSYQHVSGSRSFFDIPKDTDMDRLFIEDCCDPSKWSVLNSINIRKNGFVFIRPWVWRSLGEGKLVQTFLLNQKIESE
jgi:hypothetical protein